VAATGRPAINARTAQNEAERLEAIYGWEILEVPPDSFEQIAALAARIFEVPYAVVTVVDKERVWFRAHHGLEADSTPRDDGLCNTVVCTGEPLILPDARLHPESLSNPLVAGEFGLRFYAGAPLRTSDGYTLGTLAVMDQQPREVTGKERDVLAGLSELVVREFELRLAARVRAADDAERTELEHNRASNLETALYSHGVIGQAMGLLMAQRRCDSRTAFGALRKASNERNLELAELAHRIVTAAERPGPSSSSSSQ
jgi:GAF domain-containing protein